MRTDALFYELFQAAPQTFFELLQITPTCTYRFESITVKMSEKRIDGVLEPSQAGERIYFAEVQVFPDEVIYWRVLREVATFFEQRPSLKDNNWQAIVLWLNKEISDMLRLTPLAETISGQELIKDERLAILSRQIQIRFQLSDELTEAISQDLEKLDLPTLKLLLEEILRIETFEQLEVWISEQVAAHQ